MVKPFVVLVPPVSVTEEVVAVAQLRCRAPLSQTSRLLPFTRNMMLLDTFAEGARNVTGLAVISSRCSRFSICRRVRWRGWVAERPLANDWRMFANRPLSHCPMGISLRFEQP